MVGVIGLVRLNTTIISSSANGSRVIKFKSQPLKSSLSICFFKIQFSTLYFSNLHVAILLGQYFFFTVARANTQKIFSLRTLKMTGNFLHEKLVHIKLQKEESIKKPKQKIKFQKLLEKIKAEQNSKLEKTVNTQVLGGGKFAKLKERI